MPTLVKAVVALVAIVALALVPGIVDRARPKPATASQELVDRIARAAVPLDNLEPMRGARMVALGGSDTNLKRQITESLVKQMAFRHIVVDIDPRLGKLVSDYVQGDPIELPIAGPLAGVVRWMRQYNASVPKAQRLEFDGFDYPGQQRDFRMAQNVLDLLDHAGPSERFVLWSDNQHVSKDTGRMGFYLRRTLRNQLYVTGFEFPGPSGDTRYYAEALSRTGRPILFLDFRSAARDPEVEAWLNEPHLSHQDTFFRWIPAWTRTDQPWPSLYDGVVYSAKP